MSSPCWPKAPIAASVVCESLVRLRSADVIWLPRAASTGNQTPGQPLQRVQSLFAPCTGLRAAATAVNTGHWPTLPTSSFETHVDELPLPGDKTDDGENQSHTAAMEVKMRTTSPSSPRPPRRRRPSTRPSFSKTSARRSRCSLSSRPRRSRRRPWRRRPNWFPRRPLTRSPRPGRPRN